MDNVNAQSQSSSHMLLVIMQHQMMVQCHRFIVNMANLYIILDITLLSCCCQSKDSLSSYNKGLNDFILCAYQTMQVQIHWIHHSEQLPVILYRLQCLPRPHTVTHIYDFLQFRMGYLNSKVRLIFMQGLLLVFSQDTQVPKVFWVFNEVIKIICRQLMPLRLEDFFFQVEVSEMWWWWGGKEQKDQL